MAEHKVHSIDARHSTFNIIDKQYNQHCAAAQCPSNQLPFPLSFNDAPIDLLSSHFTGRTKELKRMGQVFATGSGDEPTRFALYSMPGMGKTQLALQYAVSSYSRRRYTLIFWISGATIEKLNQGLAKILLLVGHPDRDHPDQSTRLTSARRWLEESDTNGNKWLLILDNVSQDAEVVGFLKENLPHKNSTGNILLTTRTIAVAEAVTAVAGQQHQTFELRTPCLSDAATQLKREAGVDRKDALPAATAGAEALAKCIGCLPLAISHAASFAKSSHKNLNSVLALYRSAHKYEVGLFNFFRRSRISQCLRFGGSGS